MHLSVRQQLEAMNENEYRAFTNKLVPGAKRVLGIRMPLLRTLAKQTAARLGVEALQEEDIYYEEIMLRGMVIAALKISEEQRLELMRGFVPLIDNWAVCDAFCSSLKKPHPEDEALWDFLEPYVHSDREFEQRFAAVMLLCRFVTEAYIGRTVCRLTEICTDDYYSSMAVAWTGAECYIKFPEQSAVLLSEHRLSTDTHNRMIRKLCESYRIAPQQKAALKQLKRV